MEDFNKLREDEFKFALLIALNTFNNEEEVSDINVSVKAHQESNCHIVEVRRIKVSKKELRDLGLKDDLIPTEEEVEKVFTLLDNKLMTKDEKDCCGIAFYDLLGVTNFTATRR